MEGPDPGPRKPGSSKRTAQNLEAKMPPESSATAPPPEPPPRSAPPSVRRLKG